MYVWLSTAIDIVDGSYYKLTITDKEGKCEQDVGGVIRTQAAREHEKNNDQVHQTMGWIAVMGTVRHTKRRERMVARKNVNRSSGTKERKGKVWAGAANAHSAQGKRLPPFQTASSGSFTSTSFTRGSSTKVLPSSSSPSTTGISSVAIAAKEK